MQDIGLRRARLLTAPASVTRRDIVWVILGAVIALGPALWMWGFTVDDALISVRYARHLVGGYGWRFNVGGPTSDGVTPLPWPILLAPLARAGPLVVLGRAKSLGLAAWVASGALLGGAVGRVRSAPLWVRASTLAIVGLCVPVAAHATSGMETSVATLLATAAVTVNHRPRLTAVLAGLAASLRPEMAPWACALVGGQAVMFRSPPSRIVLAGALALGPFVACALVRTVAWGRAAPLAILAKPSDLEHGLVYAGAACVVTLVPILVCAPWALSRSPLAAVLVGAAIVHGAAIVAVGGDWMPLARLMVPVVPSLAYAAVLVGADAHGALARARFAAAGILGAALVARGGTDGRRVGADRRALVDAARPWLHGARRVATVDVGWVSAATEAEIVDLAGVTDASIAALPGGHTSKRIGVMALLERNPDALLLYTPVGMGSTRLQDWHDGFYPRQVEGRLAADESVRRHFAPVAWLSLGTQGAGYVLLWRTDDPSDR